MRSARGTGRKSAQHLNRARLKTATDRWNWNTKYLQLEGRSTGSVVAGVGGSKLRY